MKYATVVIFTAALFFIGCQKQEAIQKMEVKGGTDNTNAISEAMQKMGAKGGGTIIFQGNKVYAIIGTPINWSRHPLTIDEQGASIYALFDSVYP